MRKNLMKNFRPGFFVACIISLGVVFFVPELFGQSPTDQTYQTPPKVLADLVDAPETPMVELDPTYTRMLLLEQPGLPSIEELAQPELRIAGLRLNPKTSKRSRTRYYTGLKLKKISSGDEKAINGLPENSKILNVSWAPNGKRIAFVIVEENQQSLWVAETGAAKAMKLLDGVNSTYGRPYYWLPDSKFLVCKTNPVDRGEAPKKPSVPSGPVIQQTSGKKAAARTYQDLLENEHDENLLEYHLSVQLVKTDLQGKLKSVGSVGMIRRAEPSPNGEYLLIERVHRPFSYLVPVRRFPYKVEIWDLSGQVIKEIADLPLAEEVPIGRGAVPSGPRSFDWRSDSPATIYWAEAQDGGDPRVRSEVRDRILMQAAPFDSEPTPLGSLGLRYNQILWGNENLALAYEVWWRNRQVRAWQIDPSAPGEIPTLVFDYSFQDRYNDPGNPIMTHNAMGHSVLLTGEEGKKIYLTGAGGSPEGDRPFLDELDLATKKIKRLWRSEAPY